MPPMVGRLALLSLAAACGGRAGVELPAFAADLPGTTTVVLWSAQGSPPPAVSEALDALATSLGLTRQAPMTGVAAWSAPATVAVGWANLAAATPFRDAIAGLAIEAPCFAYVDLQLLQAALPREAEGIFAVVRERLQRALVLDGFRFVAVGIREADDGLHIDGTIATTGVAAGLPGLLTSVVPQARGLPLADADTRLQIHAQYDPAILRRTVRALSNPATASRTNALQMMLDSTVGQLLDRVVMHLGEWASVRVSERSGELQIGLSDAAALADEDGEWLERLASMLPRGTSQVFRYELRADRAVLFSGSPLPVPEQGEAHTDAAFSARVELEALPGARLAVSMRRASARSVRIEATFQR